MADQSVSEWGGAVLCGGASRRMGQDKALVEVDGEAMAQRVAQAASAAGADEVVAVGGDAEALAALGLNYVPDRWPGEGPLGGLLTALHRLPRDVVFVVSCDLVRPSPEEIVRTVATLADDVGAAVAVPRTPDGRKQWLHSAWRRRVLPHLARQFESGERAIHRATHAAGLAVVEMPVRDAAALADADTPEDLPD